MRFVIFSPTNKQSAIARVTALVTKHLIDSGHDVAIVRAETESLLDDQSYDFGVQVLRWDDVPTVSALIQNSDLLVYQIGNSFAFHKGCLAWLRDYPGVVCLHDFYLGHLFFQAMQSHRREAEAILASWYGQQAADSFFRFADSTTFIEQTSQTSPMTEWISAMALGVITHSQWGCARVLNSCPGPVRVVPLPYNAIAADAVREHHHNDGFRLLNVGHVNANKRIASVIKAIALSPLLKTRITYHIVGRISSDTAASLSDLANNLDVRLVISGEVDEQELSAAFAESDALTCLRWPCLEAASASAIEAMLHGKAVIVTNAGFYSELPDDCVVKISPEREPEQLQTALERLVRDRDFGNAMGERAKQWAAETFSADNYAQQLIEIAAEVARAKPVIDAFKRMGQRLRDWSEGADLLRRDELLKNFEIFQL